MLALFGTASNVGKSTIVTGLCRVFSNRGISVAPFKAQNISNNAGVTSDGLEMSRAQITQAYAARIEPHVDMNPVLLKPHAKSFQRIVNGKVASHQTNTFSTASRSLSRLRKKYPAVIIEGAGSCAEVNLLKTDPCNFRIAQLVNAPVILVADMYWGGVFSQLIGTLACLPRKYQDMIIGFIINRYTGSRKSFQSSISWIEKKTGKPVLGLLPVLKELNLPDEDSIERDRFGSTNSLVRIAIIKLPHIANTSDFTPLFAIPDISVSYLKHPQDLSALTALIIPGTKCTIQDMYWLRKTGWEKQIHTFAKTNKTIFGICGGFQMLGKKLSDPYHIESNKTSIGGLGLLPISTTFYQQKVLRRKTFVWQGTDGIGYEIHQGRSEFSGDFFENGSIGGTYLHGFFDTYAIRLRWLHRIGYSGSFENQSDTYDDQYERLAQHLERHLAIDRLLNMLQYPHGYNKLENR